MLIRGFPWWPMRLWKQRGRLDQRGQGKIQKGGGEMGWRRFTWCVTDEGSTEHIREETQHGRVMVAIKFFLVRETMQWSWGTREKAERIKVLVKQGKICAKAEGRTEWKNKRTSATDPSIFKSWDKGDVIAFLKLFSYNLKLKCHYKID